MKRLGCGCEPWHGAGSWRHSGSCAITPNAKLNDEERTMLRHPSSDVVRAEAGEPRGGEPRNALADLSEMGRPYSVQTWLNDPVDCRCDMCLYIDAHLDSADDDGGVGA